jgi:flagellar biosynthesis/type III secretory pathway protein FliH
MNAPTPPAKFTFDTEFFEVVGGGRNATAITLPQSSGRSAEAKLQQAYTEGHTAGVTEGQQQAQADLARLQQHTQNTLLAMQQALEARDAKLLNNLLGLLQGTLQNLLGHASQHYGAEVLEHHLRALLPLAKPEEQLTLRLHPAARGYHERLNLPHATILGLPLRIVPDSTLGPTDALVEWQHGGVEARLAEHAAAIQALLTAAGATPLPKPDFTTPTLPPVAATATPTLSPAAPANPDDPVANAAQARAARAAALLGDDDLVDALK